MIEKLYFGTPYPSFRTKILKATGLVPENFKTTHTYVIGHGKKHSTVKSQLCQTALGEYLKSGKVLEKLFSSLTKDYYRPLQLMELYSQVFEGEHFAPRSSPDKMHQALKRLRHYFESQKTGLIILEKNGFYKLESKPGVQVHLEISENNASSNDIRVNTLMKSFFKCMRNPYFTSKEFAQKLGFSKRTAIRILNAALKKGILKTQGNGPSTIYY